MTESPMLREVLHREWGFDGRGHVGLVRGALDGNRGARAGLDLLMPGPTGPWGEALVAAVREGRVPQEAVDDKVLRLLRLAGRVGALEGAEPATPRARAWPGEEVAAELRDTAGGVVRAAAQRRPSCPLDAGALRRVASRPARGARADAGRRQRHRVPALHGRAARRAARRAGRRRHGRPCARRRGRTRGWRRAAGAPARRAASRSASSTRDGACSATSADRRRLHLAGRLHGRAADDAVSRVEVHAGVRATEAGEHVVGCSGSGASR
jgi:beta-glucosidase